MQRSTFGVYCDEKMEQRLSCASKGVGYMDVLHSTVV